jgi:type I restriction enzyme S subunit
MEVRPGYKQTEVGVIPADWDVADLQKICAETITYGIVQCGPNIENGVPYIRVSDMNSPNLDVSGMLRTSLTIAAHFSRSQVKEGDIVYALRGKIGEVRDVDAAVAGANLTQGTARLSPNGRVNSTYLLWCLRSQKSLRQGDLAAKGSTFREITLQALRRIQLPIAPLPEQRAIAAGLSDVDALLAKLGQFIAKKRDLKQAVMQQLLTGQTRLPGFSGEWEVKRLGDLFRFSGGYSASRDQLSIEGHCYLHYGDIHGSLKTTIDAKADYQVIPKLDIPLKRVSPDSLLADGDMVFVDASEDDAGTSKHVVVVNKAGLPFISGLHTIVAKAKTAELAHEYLRYCFQTPAIREQFMFYAVGTKVSGISKSNIVKLTLPVPSVPEQTAIAAILCDMDNELTALETRRDKTRALKQGMMQELLTGRIRLV